MRSDRCAVTMVTVLASAILVLCHCSNPSSPSTGTVTGTVVLENQTDNAGVTVKLYAPAEIDPDLADLQSLHPNIGITLNQKVIFDHRLADLIATANTAANGSYSLKNLPIGRFVLVAEKDGFGHQKRCDVTVKASSETAIPEINLLEEKELSGTLIANTALEAHRHYLVIGDVTVPSYITLTIEPGVHIKFDGYYTLLINGRMEAVGTEEDMIVFTSQKQVPSKDDWKRIEFSSSGQGSEMCWCKIEYATSGIYGKAVPLSLSHNVVKNSTENGILIFSTFTMPVEVKNNLIINSNKGLWLEDVGNGTIENNIAFENQELGIGCQQSSPLLKNNLCMANEYGLYLVYNSNAQCRNNVLLNNDWGMACGGDSKPLLRLCNFTDNSQGAIHIFIPPRGSRAQPTIRYSNFEEQTILIRVTGGPQAPNDLDIDATNNFWGGFSVEEIDRLILDKSDATPDLAPYVAQVFYLPMETAEIDSAGLL